MIEERDISVAMRDGTRLAVDVYRPDAPGRYPVLYASALHNKDIQGLTSRIFCRRSRRTHRSGSDRSRRAIRGGSSPMGMFTSSRSLEGLGEIGRSLRPRGYRPLRPDRMDYAATVVKRQGRHGRHLRLRRRAMARSGAGTSGAEGHLSVRRMQRVWRHVRIPRFQSRRRAAHVPVSPRRVQHRSRIARSTDRTCRREEELWRRAMRNPDYKQYVNLYNILTQKGQRTFVMYLMMTHPWERTELSNAQKKSSRRSGYRFTQAQELTPTPTSFTGSARSTTSRTSMRRRS